MQEIGLRYIKNSRTFDDEFLFTFIRVLVTYCMPPPPGFPGYLCLLEKGKSRLQDAMEFLATQQWENNGG